MRTRSLGRALPNVRKGFYLPVRAKFAISVLVALAWALFSFNFAGHWIADLSLHIGAFAAHLIIFGIAILPGFMNAFILASLLLDRRPPFAAATDEQLPPVTILIAAYNEEASIGDTLKSLDVQSYLGEFSVVVVDDGSTDRTAEIVDEARHDYPWLQVIHLPRNSGKSAALNAGLKTVGTEYVITVDGDSYLFHDALANLVRRQLSDPPDTVAVAGAVLVRNSRKNLVTKLQEWDYFLGIAAVKRVQSLYQGTLVAQGAFSIYRTDVLRAVGGWQHVVGEDIVLTWALLEAGHRIGYCENACLFTDAPDTLRQFMRQRQRWARGLIEAFKSHWRLLFKLRMTTMFIWWNALFPYIDLVYVFVFLPGLLLALFGYFFIAGPLTLLLLPLALLINYVMFHFQRDMFQAQGLKVRRNVLGFVLYVFFYGIIMQSASVSGYFKEIFLRTKNWGTK